jgi:polyisoprenoid-binding protein YceI
MKSKLFKIVGSQSIINWTGRKVTGSHYGTITIKEGVLELTDGNLTGGKFVADTTSIKILDVTDPATNAQFAGHLASDDFFSSEKYPEALFVITSAVPHGNNIHGINGELTIRGVTHPITFRVGLNADDNSLTATGKIIIDRTLYGMKFRSGNFFKDLGDILIYNDFDLEISITARA